MNSADSGSLRHLNLKARAFERRRLRACQRRSVTAGAALRVERPAASGLRVGEDAVLHGSWSLRVDRRRCDQQDGDGGCGQHRAEDESHV